MPVKPDSIVVDWSRDSLLDRFAIETLKDRYLVGNETSPQQAFARAAAAFADDESHAQRLYDYASKLYFMFSTPVLANGGTDRGLPISCYLNAVDDSREGILNNYTENGWLTSMGGGIGTYWGNLRSVGEHTSKGSKTSGVIPFVKVVDAQMLAFHQGGTRRGSTAVYLDITHPEIEEWIVMRKPSGGDENRKTTNLHNAINITDEFMIAVENGWPFALIDPHSKAITKTVKARDLWRLILETRVETGEPYLHFIDTSNRALPEPLKKLGLKIRQSNLCSEIILPTNENRTAVCCLSSVNLEKFDEWKENIKFIDDLMRMLDNVLDWFIQKAPNTLWRAKFSAANERSVGLGSMGFHSYLQSKHIPIESETARAYNVMMFKHLDKCTKEASYRLGFERGEAPDMVGTGLRFGHRMANAPNASSSIFCGGTSPSTEPNRANAYVHRTLSGSFPVKNRHLVKILQLYDKDDEETWKSIINHEGSVQQLSFLSDRDRSVFKTAIEIEQLKLVILAADRQYYIDQSQSFNLFFTSDVSAKELHQTHFKAWQKGVKTLYYLRSQAAKRGENVNTKVARNQIIQFEEPDCVACEG